MHKPALAAVAIAAVLIADTIVAQGSRSSPPLPELPRVLATSDYAIRVVEVAGGLANPWSLAFLPNGNMLVTERPGRLRIFHDGALDPAPVAGVPEVRVTALGGLLDVVLHPDYETNGVIYLSYSKDIDGENSTTAIARGRFDGSALESVEDIFVASTRSDSVVNFGGRMAFGRDGHLYMAVGERQEQDRAQDTMDHGGKVIRLRDGGVPEDNPFVGQAGYLPEIWSLGHRSPQGLAVHPETGELWENEHGPLGGDEINIVRSGRNYGWPTVSYGNDYDGTQITDTGLTVRDDLESPFMYWVPSIAISGMSFYAGDAFPEWQGNAFVGAMMEGRIRWTGHIQRLTFNDAGAPITREPMLAEFRQRIRDVRPGTRRPALRADGRKPRRLAQDRTRRVTPVHLPLRLAAG